MPLYWSDYVVGGVSALLGYHFVASMKNQQDLKARYQAKCKEKLQAGRRVA